MGLRRRAARLSSCSIKTLLCALGEIFIIFLQLAYHSRRKVGWGGGSGVHSFEAFLELVHV